MTAFKFPKKTFVVAEISANHNGGYDNAVELFMRAKRAGADAVKLQCYTPDEMTINIDSDDFVIHEGPWRGRTLYELYSEGQTPREWFKPLFKLAKKLKLTAFSSVFSKDGVDFLEKLKCPIYKIASFEVTDVPLMEYAVATGKPVIASAGVATEDDFRDVIHLPDKWLYCVSDYPAKNIKLPAFGGGFEFLTMNNFDGLSDHTLSTLVPALAVARGATIVEKHLTLDRAAGGLDCSFSLNPDEFCEMVLNVREAWDAIHGPRPMKSPYEYLCRSLYVVEDIEIGELFTEKNVRSIRPGFGIAPKHLKTLIGTKALSSYKRGTPL